MPNKEETIKGGLRELSKDNRDFSLTKVFGSMYISDIPDIDFMVSDKFYIKDQKNSDICVAAACSAVSEDQEGVMLSMEWFFSQIKKMEGDYRSWGADIRSGMKTGVKVGFMEKVFAEYSLSDGRDFIANYENWNKALFPKALSHKKKSYFAVDGPYDFFNNCRANLWLHREDKASIVTGVLWQRGWINAKDGIIDFEGVPAFGHALKICGQKKIKDKWYLVAQLSNGTSIGDKGFFYFSQEIINKHFTFGAYMYKDMPPEDAKKVAWNFWRKLLEKIRQILNTKIC